MPFESIANKYKGKSVWVLDRDKIRKRVAQVVDSAIRDALGDMPQTGSIDATDLRKQVSEAIGGLFKDNRNLTSQVSDNAMKMDHQVRRIEQMVQRAESVLAQMTIAISRIGSGGGWGGGGGGPRRLQTAGGGGSEQNSVLLEIFKENLRLRGISIDEPPPADAAASGAGARRSLGRQRRIGKYKQWRRQCFVRSVRATRATTCITVECRGGVAWAGEFNFRSGTITRIQRRKLI